MFSLKYKKLFYKYSKKPKIGLQGVDTGRNDRSGGGTRTGEVAAARPTGGRVREAFFAVFLFREFYYQYIAWKDPFCTLLKLYFSA